MKRFLAVLLTLTMLLGVMSLSLASFAAEGETEGTLVPKELTLEEGKNYAFYAQTRDSETEGHKDVRIICVANEAWITAATTAYVNLTFTDGTTPVTSKNLTFTTVYRQITAAGEVEGTTDVYTVADGLVMFGWVVTDVPEAYADLTNNAPKASITTDSTSNPEAPSTPVDPEITSVTLNAVDGELVAPAVKHDEGYVNGLTNNEGSITFTLDGNYEGLWKMDVYSIDFGGRDWTVTVNGVAQKFQTVSAGTWDDISKAVSVSINAELKNGENTIVFTCPTKDSPHLVKIEMNKYESIYEYIEEVESAFTLSAYDDGVISGNGTRNQTATGNYVNGLLTSRPSSLSFFLNGNYEGVWRLDVYSIGFGGRDWTVTVNGGAAQTFTPPSVNTWDDTSLSAPVSIYAELKNGLNIIEITSPSEFSPHLVKVGMEKVDKVPTAIPGTSITTISGPKFGETDTEGNVVVNGEGTQTLFDGLYTTKLCANGTKADGTEQYKVPIVLKFDEAKKLTGISIYNANDNATSPERTVVYVKIWVSNDGVNWGDAPAVVINDQTPKAQISANYLHRYFAFDEAINAQYVKLEIVNDGMYQMSEVVFYQ